MSLPFSTFSWSGPKAMALLGAGVRARIKIAAQVVRRDIVTSFQKTESTGETYRSSKGGQRRTLHARSEPGETPAVQTGTLRRSIQVDFGESFLGPYANVGPGTVAGGDALKYAKFLEFGTRKMAPRPYMVPALYRNRLRVGAILGGIKI